MDSHDKKNIWVPNGSASSDDLVAQAGVSWGIPIFIDRLVLALAAISEADLRMKSHSPFESQGPRCPCFCVVDFLLICLNP